MYMGTYKQVSHIGNQQAMKFSDEDQGTFHPDPQDEVCRKNDKPTEKVEFIKKTKK